MSLENQITALTEAVIELTNAVREKNYIKGQPEAVAPYNPDVTDVVAKALKAPKAPAAAAASQPPETDAASSASGKRGTSPAPEYAEVKAALMAVNDKHGRDLVIQCLQRLGVSKGTELVPDQYRKALDVFNVALEIGSV